MTLFIVCWLFLLQRIFPEWLQASISESLWRARISFLALNELHEKGEAWLESSRKSKDDFMQGCLWQRLYSFFFPSSFFCQNFPATEMISQARCVFVCTAAVGAVLLGVVDGDNVALWLELTSTESAAVACSTSGRKREGGEGRLCRSLVR